MNSDAAREALEHGRTALAAGDRPTAIRWFHRVRRLAPHDISAIHLLASAMSATDPAGALALLNPLVTTAPRREILLSRIALLLRCNDLPAAALALDHLLSNFAVPLTPAFNALASRIAGPRGWLGATGTGLVICAAPALDLAFDSAPPFLKSAPPGTHPLPPAWRKAAILRAPGPLLGATINLAAIRQIQGFVAFHPNHGLHGWALAPADPDTIPRLDIFAASARTPFATIPADRDSGPLEIPPHARYFQLAALPPAPSFRVRTPDGHDLAGSPITPILKPAPRRRKTPKSQIPPRRPVEIIALPPAEPRIAAINTALRRAAGRDVLLLNNDTPLPPAAIARLADAAYAAPDIGTATPLTNNGPFDADMLAANAGLRIDIPTCSGFCTYIRHDCLADTGLFREDAFAQGYGEENDFSRRAAHLGWRHVAACDVMVPHDGGVSISAAHAALKARNLEILERLHPGYLALMSDFANRDPLRVARAAYDARRWAAARRGGATILVTHDSGGGVERHVASRVDAIRALGLRAIVVRPRDGFAISDGTSDTHPDLRFATVDELVAFLRPDQPCAVELHHIADHASGIESLAAKLGVPFDVVVHDYAAICPRVTLCAGGLYCGEPADVAACDACIERNGAQMPFSGKVGDLRDSQRALFGAARQVLVATQDAAQRLRRHLGDIEITVRPWENDAHWRPVVRTRASGQVHVGVVGGIGTEKGFFVLLACARDAAARDLPLRFTVIGHTIGDRELMDTGRVFVTGRYEEGEAAALLRDAAPDIGFLPSVSPETWCYALSALWEAQLHVVAFDLGAPAERMRAHGAGTLLSLGTRAGAINDRMLELMLVQRMPALA